jgi:hypothetical protein
MCMHPANYIADQHYDAYSSFSWFISWVSAHFCDYTLHSYDSPSSFWPRFHTHLALHFMIMNCCQNILSFVMKVVLY